MQRRDDTSHAETATDQDPAVVSMVDGRGPGPGRGKERGDQRPRGVLGPVNENVDRRETRNDDGQLEKRMKNKLYCHTHGYECTDGHDSAHCMYPKIGHKPCATAENPMGGCMLYKRLYTAYCLEYPG